MAESQLGVSDEETTGHPGPVKRQKSGAGSQWRGAALYKTKFQKSWKQAWPFVAPVKDLHSFHSSTSS